MEEKIRAKAINAKFDEDIKAAAVRYEVLNAQRGMFGIQHCMHQKSTRISQANIVS